MRILFDPQIFYLSSFGMYRYYATLYKGLLESGVEIICPVKASVIDNELPQKISVGEWLSKNWKMRVERIQRKIVLCNYYRAISKSNYDLLYITSSQFETDFLNYLSQKPFAMTVHDTMRMVKSNHSFFEKSTDIDYDALGYLAHYAERVACVSEHTRNDLSQKYLVNKNKTNVVYPANFLSREAEKIEHLPESYILFVGVRSGRKNFFSWLKAIADYLSQYPSLHIVVTGELNESEIFFSKKFGIERNLVSFNKVTDAQLNTLYRNALCLAFPSLYEGFGLPVLEAMANGCPVITSNRSSLREVAGSAALLVDPLDGEMMLNALKMIHQNDNFREELIKKGLKQSKKFSTENFIEGMIDFFIQAIPKL